jgi:hypothetical protein
LDRPPVPGEPVEAARRRVGRAVDGDDTHTIQRRTV